MKTPILPPDDLAPVLTPLDRSLLLQLKEVVNKQFYNHCDRITQALLTQCQWSITTNSDVPTLMLTCPDAETYWNIVDSIETISRYLSNITHTSRIKVIPGDRKNIYFEVEIGG
jgi:hypothetical protein